MAGKKNPPVDSEQNKEKTAEQKAEEEAIREKRRLRGMAIQERKESIAKERGSLVVKPLFSAEAASYFNFGQQVIEDLFEMPIMARIRRDQNAVQKAGIIYRKAFIAFATEIKKASKILNSRYLDNNYIAVFEKELKESEQLQEFLEHKGEFDQWKASQQKDTEKDAIPVE